MPHNTATNRIALVLHFRRRRLIQLIEISSHEGLPVDGLEAELAHTLKIARAFACARAANETGRTRLVELPPVVLQQVA